MLDLRPLRRNLDGGKTYSANSQENAYLSHSRARSSLGLCCCGRHGSTRLDLLFSTRLTVSTESKIIFKSDFQNFENLKLIFKFLKAKFKFLKINFL